jgi:hypothetical protein
MACQLTFSQSLNRREIIPRFIGASLAGRALRVQKVRFAKFFGGGGFA